LKEKIKKKF